MQEGRGRIPSSLPGSVASSSNFFSPTSLARTSFGSFVDQKEGNALTAKLKKLDYLAGPKAEFRRGTVHGFIATVAATLFSAYLLVQELRYSMKIHTHDFVVVNDQHRTYDYVNRLPVTFDVVFPSLDCASISLGAVDNKGVDQQGIVHIVYKTDLSQSGKALRKTTRIENMGNTVTADHLSAFEQEEIKREFQALLLEPAPSGECGDCYGAAPEGTCCNTCNDVKEVFEIAGREFDEDAIPQCRPESQRANGGAPPGKPVGCRVHGVVELTEGQGNLHFAPGLTDQELSPKDLVESAFTTFDASHTIQTLRFGKHVPGTEYPLEGVSRSSMDTLAMHQYFIKVIGTKYVPLAGETVVTNRYSVTELVNHVEPGVHKKVPGLFINYEVSPMSALVKEDRVGILSFLTSVCAVIGGIYAIFGIANSGFEHFQPRGHHARH